MTPAGAASSGKLIQKTLFGDIVDTSKGKSPRTKALRSKVKKAIVVNKDNADKLRQQINNMAKRKADNMAPSTVKLSPPEKTEKKTEIIKDYDEEEVRSQQPDRPITPPPDVTGHIVSVLADTPSGQINSAPKTNSDNTEISAAEPESEQEKQKEK